MTSGMDKALEAALHEARIYGIGATSDHNQKIILEAASRFAALSPPEPTEEVEAVARAAYAVRYPEHRWALLDAGSPHRIEFLAIARAALRAMHTNGWQDISTNQKDGDDVIVWTSEGLDIARYSDVEHDGPDSMGHDAGWWGLNTPMDPGRHMGNPAYFREPVCQPTHWLPIEPPASLDDDDVRHG